MTSLAIASMAETPPVPPADEPTATNDSKIVLMAGHLPPDDDPDVLAMARVAGGDSEGLREIIQRWQTPLINFFYRSLRSYETAEDLTQMTFIRLYRAAHRYQPQAKFSTYLFQIARRLLINEYRRQSRKPLDHVDPADLSRSASARTPLRTLEIEDAFRHALAQLPENHQTALLLLKQQQLSYEEIAAAMETSVSSVKTWIHRARARLRELLAEWVPS